VVLGHSCCGAVQATIETLQSSSESDLSAGMQTIVKHIGVSVALAGDDVGAIVEQTIEKNVRHSVAAIRTGSSVLEGLIADEGLMVVGAKYHLTTGRVEFLDC